MVKLTDFLFIAQVMILAAIVIRWSARRRVPGVAGLGLIGWLALTGSLAIRGFFQDWSRLPPRMLPAPLVPLIGGLLLLFYSRQMRALLAATPLQWPIYLQSFRIVMEIILWLLFVQHRAPVLMTFEGRNVDILVGLTAIPVGYFCFVRKSWPRQVALWWNVIGVLVLLNVVVHAQLATPSPFRVFVTDPPVTFIGDWPYIWLPGFLVPLAWLMHAASIIQLRRS
jgi:hypothetical protein